MFNELLKRKNPPTYTATSSQNLLFKKEEIFTKIFESKWHKAKPRQSKQGRQFFFINTGTPDV